MTITAIIVAVGYWTAESIVHRFVFAEDKFELLPANVNEIWMRALIVLLMICFGIFGDAWSRRLVSKEDEKRQIFIATISSTQHILNNLLNQIQVVLLEMDDEYRVDAKTREMLKRSLKDAQAQVEQLSAVTKLDEEAIRDSVAPK
jgi:signal transduction histidine kinase